MGKQLNALILEDSPSDALLLLRELKRNGFDVDHIVVENAEDMKAALREREWDIILSDFSMPSFDAPAALRVVQEGEIDIPFIIVSGTIGEDAAIAAMKAGASDYFLKGKLTRLAPTIERELQEAHSRRQRREAETRFAAAFQASPIGISILRQSDWQILDVNGQYLEIFGYVRQEFIGRNGLELDSWGTPEQRRQVSQQLRETGSVRNVEVEIHKASGRKGYALLSAETIELNKESCILVMMHDISDRKEAEAALRASEEKFRLLAENSTDMISRSTPEGIILYVSPASRTLFGYEPEELIGHSSHELLRLGDLRAIANSHATILKTPETYTVAHRRRRKDGSYIWVETTSRTVRDPLTNEVIEIQSATRDISQRKEAEESLKRYAERLELLHEIDRSILRATQPQEIAQTVLVRLQAMMSFDSASVIAFDPEKDRFSVLADIAPIADFDPDEDVSIIELLRRNEIYRVDDLQQVAVKSPNEQALARAGIRTFVRLPLHASGELLGSFDLRAVAANAFSTSELEIALEVGAQLAIAIHNAQLYQKNQSHAELLEQQVQARTAELQVSEAKYRALVEFAPDPIVIVDASGAIALINERVEERFGYTPHEIIGQPITILLPEGLRDLQAAHRFTDMAESKQAMGANLDLTVRHKNGTKIPVRIGLSPIDVGAETLMMAYIIDVSADKQLEASLRAALAKEKELNELKTSFTSMVSHEFRTPLSVITSSTWLLTHYHDRMDQDRRQEKLENISRQVKRLVKLLDDVLVVTRADAVGFELNPRSIDLNALCQIIIEDVRAGYDQGVIIDFTYDFDRSQTHVDEFLFTHILQNLLSNAIKYSPAGGMVHIDVAGTHQELILRVKDQGIGIPEEYRHSLFEAFRRASNVGQIPGTGLGLTIVRRAVEAYGGTIEVESAEGKGTTFIVNLPRLDRGPR